MNEIAADPAGTVYTAESAGNRIQKFDSTGNFQRAWGKDVVTGGGTGAETCTAAASCKWGSFTDDGLGTSVYNPLGLAADGFGNVFVITASRIQKFNSSGGFVLAWGKDVISGGATGYEVCSVSSDCNGGLPGSLGGEFFIPLGLATDAAGDVYVADFINQRLQRFDSSGGFVAAIGAGVNGGARGLEVCTVRTSCKTGHTSIAEDGGEMKSNNVAVGGIGDISPLTGTISGSEAPVFAGRRQAEGEAAAGSVFAPAPSSSLRRGARRSCSSARVRRRKAPAGWPSASS